MSAIDRPTRRGLLKGGIGGSLAMLGLGCHGSTATSRDDRRRIDDSADFCFAHLTDAHVTARRNGDAGYRTCVAHVNANPNRPAFVMMGGDGAFDGLYTERDIFERDVELFRSISAQLAMPYHHAIGNHDLLGLSSRRKVPVDDPELGKAFIMKRLVMKRSYYSFDHQDWHFAVLDSIYPLNTASGPSYEARIGEEQLHWLAYDLGAAGDRPKVVLTHIAAFCDLGTVGGDPKALAMNPNLVLRDTKDLRLVLERHKVKALLQGHSHIIETAVHNGVHYVTSPAVSSAWWGGTWTGSPPSYTIFRCRGDQLSWEYVPFGWTIQRDPQDTLEVEKQATYDAEQAEQLRLAKLERAGMAAAAVTPA